MSVNKKVIYIIFSAVLIGVAGFFIFKIYFLDGAGQGSVTGQSSAGDIKTSNPAFPQGDFLSIGTSRGEVSVKNFYKAALGFDEQFVILKRNQNYEINYDTYTSGFSVYVSAAPFATNQQVAENDFLGILGISQADACKLKVFEAVSAEVDKNMTGRNLGLSFCGGAL